MKSLFVILVFLKKIVFILIGCIYFEKDLNDFVSK